MKEATHKGLRTASPQRQKVGKWLPGAGGKGTWQVTANGYGVFLGGWWKSDCGDNCTTLNSLKIIDVYTLNG